MSFTGETLGVHSRGYAATVHKEADYKHWLVCGENGMLTTPASGNECNGVAILQTGLEAPQKTEQILHDPVIPLPCEYRITEYRGLHKALCTHVHNSMASNSRKAETIEIPTYD